jgi:hypothetical protein
VTATCVVEEVQIAVQRDYRALKIHEFYEYELTQYDPTKGEGGQFVQYIDTFLKLGRGLYNIMSVTDECSTIKR